jgi:para-nitrobenzyl esterase
MTLAGGRADAQVKTTAGLVKGTTVADGTIRVFSGIPYAAPPVGDLRWKPPQPVAPWQGEREATAPGPACLQGRVFDDISFPTMGEDCLTLNVYTPAKAAKAPVMVWIHGGGFMAGGGAEPRHDGQAFARKGIVLVTINYRLGVFGFFAHPELTKESPAKASGNYGLLDQVAALRWVKENVAAFGGDPGNVTIFGESAGSFSVSALVASPLAKGLVHKAIGESGAFFGTTLGPVSLPAAEQLGTDFAATAGGGSLAGLRALPAQQLLEATSKAKLRAGPIIDGYFLPAEVPSIYASGAQAHVPLLAGWNADEIRAAVTLRPQKPTAQSFTEETRKRFGDSADAILKAYPASTDAEAIESAAALGSDMFIGYSTWKWIEVHLATGKSPVYRYSFDRQIPVPAGHTVMGAPATSKDIGARHAGEIEYVFGALEKSLPKVPWETSDRKLSDQMTSYWANFARTGDPNGPGLPKWSPYTAASPRVLHLDVDVKETGDTQRARYEAIDAAAKAQRIAPAPPMRP